MSPEQSLAHYRILAKIGEGGMGAVYRATDTKLNRDVAIKVLPPAFAEDGARMARFEREAQLLAALNHPNIAAIYGIEQGAIVMELVEGEELRGPLPCEIAVGYAAQIAAGLEAAHEKGVIHRDLKPANIKVTAEGVIKLLDFGLAKVAEETAHSTAAGPTISPTLSMKMTQAGMILGTAAYMAPEQARGAAVDKRADIWAFGVVLMEMLTGVMSFRGETVSDTLAGVLRAPIDWSALPPDTPPLVRRLLERCLERDPKRRLRDIGEARIALSEPDVLKPAAVPPPSTVVVPKRYWVLWAALGLGIVAALAATGLWLTTRDRTAPSGITRLSIFLPPGQVLTGGGPAVSRDGRIVAYTAKAVDGLARLYLRPLDRYDSIEVPGSEGAMLPFFSPDASRVGFFAGGKLLTASRGGGPPTAIADASFQPLGGTWAKDDIIYYTPSVTSGIVSIPASGGKPHAITYPDEAAKGYVHGWPQYLFDPDSVLFTLWGGLNMEANGTGLLSLRSGTWTRVASTLWASRYVRSGHLLQSDFNGVRAMAFDPKQPRGTATQTFVIDGVFSSPSQSASWFAVSDNGTLVYVPGDTDLSTMAWVDRSGVMTPISDKPQSMSDPELSPDGTRIAEVENLSIWTVDLKRGTRIRLTRDGEGANLYPIWSHDGARILFGSNRAGDWDPYSVSSGGGLVKRIFARKGSQVPLSLAPDGTLLFGERLQNRADLLMLAPDGNVAPFVVSEASKLGAQFSPDGHMVAYVSDENGRHDVYIRSLAKPEDAVAVSSGGGSEPRWSPDAKELFFRRNNAFMAAGINLNSSGVVSVGEPRKLFDASAAWGRNPNHAGYAVSPDGKRFLILRPDPRAIPTQINVVLNWFEELRTKVHTR
jgi:serine/threonine-protein kinase